MCIRDRQCSSDEVAASGSFVVAVAHARCPLLARIRIPFKPISAWKRQAVSSSFKQFQSVSSGFKHFQAVSSRRTRCLRGPETARRRPYQSNGPKGPVSSA
eukprot:6975109-Alexandrium_andersonii.AAC.1